MLHVHDLVDWVSEEAAIAGRPAARHARGELPGARFRAIRHGGRGLRTVVPQRLSVFEPGKMATRFYFRAAKPMGASLLQFWADGVLAFERKPRVVKPSEMIVADIPVRKIGTPSLSCVVPAPEKMEADDEIDDEARRARGSCHPVHRVSDRLRRRGDRRERHRLGDDPPHLNKWARLCR